MDRETYMNEVVAPKIQRMLDLLKSLDGINDREILSEANIVCDEVNIDLANIPSE